MLALSALLSLAGLWILAWALKWPVFFQTFGFSYEQSGPASALLLFGILFGLVAFWLSPLMNMLSRKHEYESDRFAAHFTGPGSMILALRKLSEKNLTNLTPHRLCSGFYYSHPTLFERERALSVQ